MTAGKIASQVSPALPISSPISLLILGPTQYGYAHACIDVHCPWPFPGKKLTHSHVTLIICMWHDSSKTHPARDNFCKRALSTPSQQKWTYMALLRTYRALLRNLTRAESARQVTKDSTWTSIFIFVCDGVVSPYQCAHTALVQTQRPQRLSCVGSKRHTYGCVMSHIWKEPCHTLNESCHT